MKRFDQSAASMLTGTQFVHEWVHYLGEQGHNVVDASRGRPTFAIDDETIDAMAHVLEQARGGIFPYGQDALGEPHYRAQVATAFTEIYGVSICPEQIVFTPGGQFSLYLIFKLLHQACPQGMFVSTNPGYLNYKELMDYVAQEAAANDANKPALSPLFAVDVSAQPHYRYTAEILQQSLQQNTRPVNAFLFCNPLNPTGQVMSAAEWEAFAQVLAQYDCPIIVDEAFFEILFTPTRQCSLLHAAPQLLNRVVLLRSGTKAQGLPGERLCVTMLPPNLVEAFRYHQSRLLGNPPFLAQAGMAAAIAQLTDEKLHAMNAYYKSNAKRLMRGLNDILGESAYTPPEGGFFLLANLRRFIGQPLPEAARELMGIAHTHIQTDEDMMAALLLGGATNDAQQGVALIPGSYFGLSPTDGVMRISYSILPEEIDLLLQRLGAMLNASERVA